MYLILSGMSSGYNLDNIGYRPTMVQTHLFTTFAIKLVKIKALIQ